MNEEFGMAWNLKLEKWVVLRPWMQWDPNTVLFNWKDLTIERT